MPAQSSPKAVTLKPSWKNYFLKYLLSILLIPLFGIGFVVLYWVYKKHNEYSYRVTDTQITSRDEKYQQNIDLVNIEKVEIQQNWLQKKLRVGDLILHASTSSMAVYGMTKPEELKSLLESAIATEKQRNKQKEKSKPKEPKHNPGSMDRMDYLTGLWQQGLVSDEDYEKERKHFE
jgi:hypothetical protein